MKINERGRIDPNEPELPKIKLSEQDQAKLDDLLKCLADVKSGKYGEVSPVIDLPLAERMEVIDDLDEGEFYGEGIFGRDSTYQLF